MRKILKKFLKWILHDHDPDNRYRIITYCEVIKKGKWKKDVWLEIKWCRTCKSCGKTFFTKVKSDSFYPTL